MVAAHSDNVLWVVFVGFVLFEEHSFMTTLLVFLGVWWSEVRCTCSSHCVIVNFFSQQVHSRSAA